MKNFYITYKFGEIYPLTPALPTEGCKNHPAQPLSPAGRHLLLEGPPNDFQGEKKTRGLLSPRKIHRNEQ